MKVQRISGKTELYESCFTTVASIEWDIVSAVDIAPLLVEYCFNMVCLFGFSMPLIK